jgi:TolB-like protein
VAEGKASRAEQASIAILPFVDMSQEQDQQWFSDGLTEEIINTLAHVPDLKVIARSSAFVFRGKDRDIRGIAKTLGVRVVLEGSIRRAGDRLRMAAQLINAEDGFHIWSERYDREMTDVFGIQDEVAAAIGEALRIRLRPDPARIGQYRPKLPACEALLKARHHVWGSFPGVAGEGARLLRAGDRARPRICAGTRRVQRLLCDARNAGTNAWA